MFWELRKIYSAISGDGLADWKAAAVIVVFEILAIVGLTNAAAVYLGRRLIDKGSPFIFLVAFAVATINIPGMLSGHRHWNKLSMEFDSYSAPIRILGGVGVVLLIVAAAIVAAYFGGAQRYLPR